jgi:hypothetical protein
MRCTDFGSWRAEDGQERIKSQLEARTGLYKLKEGLSGGRACIRASLGKQMTDGGVERVGVALSRKRRLGVIGGCMHDLALANWRSSPRPVVSTNTK